MDTDQFWFIFCIALVALMALANMLGASINVTFVLVLKSIVMLGILFLMAKLEILNGSSFLLLLTAYTVFWYPVLDSICAGPHDNSVFSLLSSTPRYEELPFSTFSHSLPQCWYSSAWFKTLLTTVPAVGCAFSFYKRLAR